MTIHGEGQPPSIDTETIPLDRVAELGSRILAGLQINYDDHNRPSGGPQAELRPSHLPSDDEAVFRGRVAEKIAQNRHVFEPLIA